MLSGYVTVCSWWSYHIRCWDYFADSTLSTALTKTMSTPYTAIMNTSNSRYDIIFHHHILSILYVSYIVKHSNTMDIYTFVLCLVGLVFILLCIVACRVKSLDVANWLHLRF